MKTPITYTPSKLLTGDAEGLRQRSLTRWMSSDLTQAAGDFCRNLGLVPIYCECTPDYLARYLFWKPPQGAAFEVRSGRTKDKFEEMDRGNQQRNMRLLSLHINESDIYSAVWISSDHADVAREFLKAQRLTGALGARQTCFVPNN